MMGNHDANQGVSDGDAKHLLSNGEIIDDSLIDEKSSSNHDLKINNSRIYTPDIGKSTDTDISIQNMKGVIEENSSKNKGLMVKTEDEQAKTTRKRKQPAPAKKTRRIKKVKTKEEDAEQAEGGAEDGTDGNKNLSKGYTGHRPVTSCTHCRQHKIKCNASDMFPNQCSRCEKMGLHCEIDPDFRPKKGSQLQSLKNDIDELKLKLEYLTRNEGLIASALNKTEHGKSLINEINSVSFAHRIASSMQGQLAHQHANNEQTLTTPNGSVHNSPVKKDIENVELTSTKGANENKVFVPITNNSNLPPVLRKALEHDTKINTSPDENNRQQQQQLLLQQAKELQQEKTNNSGNTNRSNSIMVTNAISLLPMPHADINEFVLGDVSITMEKASTLHKIFVDKYLPTFPILQTNSVTELYSQSQILFWTVMLTACLSDPEPTLYNKLASLIKQLAIETCWIQTPRSTHISQALLILCAWPLPNKKVLDDCSYRFVGLAKSLSFQLGLHRGKFMSEFTRTQTSMPQAEKWRTRTWLGIFFQEQLWSSILGLPSTSHTDYLIEQSLQTDQNIFDLPTNFRDLIHLASFQAKIYKIMGSNVKSPDGLVEAKHRAKELANLESELDQLNSKFDFAKHPCVEIYYLYVKLMLCCFAFLPDTPERVSKKYIHTAYKSAIRIITLITKILERQQLLESPIYVRQACTYSALILFKLYVTPLLDDKYVDSARQSIVTVHRLYRNQLTAWATSVENDISRTASVLEKLNFVLITNPDVFTEEEGIISRMRSHLTGTLFYDLIWCVHEARRRELDSEYKTQQKLAYAKKQKQKKKTAFRKLFPLPFYNQISKEDFETITKTTPGGTTITTLVPTKRAIQNAKKQFAKNENKNTKDQVFTINGIPLRMLNHTGSMTMLDPSLSSPLHRAIKIQTTPSLSVSETSSQNVSNSVSPQPVIYSQTSPPPQQPITHVSFNRNTQTPIALYQTSTSPAYGANKNSMGAIPLTSSAIARSELMDADAQVFKTGYNKKANIPVMHALNTANVGTPGQQPDTPQFGGNSPYSSGIKLSRGRSYLSNTTPRTSDLRTTGQTDNSMERPAVLGAAGVHSNFEAGNVPTDEVKFQSLNIFDYRGQARNEIAGSPLLNSNVPMNTQTNTSLFAEQSIPLKRSGSSSSINLKNAPSTNSHFTEQTMRDLDIFLQQQSAGWAEDNSMADDVLGLFDINMAPEF